MKKIFFGIAILLAIKSNAQEKINDDLNSLINISFHYFWNKLLQEKRADNKI